MVKLSEQLNEALSQFKIHGGANGVGVAQAPVSEAKQMAAVTR
jgi:hypothetical protein